MSHKKKLLVGAAVVLAMTTWGVAYAEWLGTATGSGRARATSTESATITASDGAADLYPGFTEGDVYFTIDNPNLYSITFTDMASGIVTSSDPTDCPVSNITVDSPVTGLSLVSPPGVSGELSIVDVVSMDSAAPDGCQDVSFDIILTLTGQQSA